MALRAIERPDAASRKAGCRLLGLVGWPASAALPRLDVLRTSDPDASVRAEADAAFKQIDYPEKK